MNKLPELWDWSMQRLVEPSTWRGIILLMTSAGITVNPEKAHAIIAVGLLVVGGINIVRREKKGASKEDLSKLAEATANAIDKHDTTLLTKQQTTK